MRTRWILRGFAALTTVLLVAAYVPQHSSAQERIVLSGVTPWVKDYYWTEAFFEFQRMVEERLGDRLEIKYLGANEIVPPFDQFEALRNGVVDVILGAASYYTGTLPEAHAVLFARLPPSELRKTGFYDVMRELHLEKGGVIYLANVGGGVDRAFRFFSNKKIDEPDFTGLRIRVTPVYVELVNALGGTPITMPPSDVYTALERGVVDGYGWSYGGIVDFGWQEVTKYVLDIGFYSANTSILINQEVWDGLPQDVRDELEQIGKELEVWADSFMADYNAKEDEMLREIGVEFLTFSPGDTAIFLETAYTTGWDAYIDAHPELGPRLRELSE